MSWNAVLVLVCDSDIPAFKLAPTFGNNEGKLNPPPILLLVNVGKDSL